MKEPEREQEEAREHRFKESWREEDGVGRALECGPALRSPAGYPGTKISHPCAHTGPATPRSATGWDHSTVLSPRQTTDFWGTRPNSQKYKMAGQSASKAVQPGAMQSHPGALLPGTFQVLLTWAQQTPNTGHHQWAVSSARDLQREEILIIKVELRD